MGRGKIDIGVSFSRTYRNDRMLAITYNKNDCLLVKELFEKLGLLKFLSAIQQVSGCMLKNTYHESAVIDTMILRKYSDYVFQSINRNRVDGLDEW